MTPAVFDHSYSFAYYCKMLYQLQGYLSIVYEERFT